MQRARRWARRACLGAAAVLLVLAVTTPGSGAQEDGGDDVPHPDVFRGTASSLAVSLEADRDALLPVPEVFRFIALDGNGTYESSSQQARASVLFPGNGLIMGPSLVCGTFGGQFPDDFKPILDTCLQYKYPLTVYADGFEPDGGTAGSLAFGSEKDTISGTAGGAKAHAGEDAVTTDAAIQDLRLLGLPPFGPVRPPIPGFELDTSMLTMDSGTSRTNQRIEKGGLVVDAEAVLSGIRMIGGLIEIGSIRSVSHVLDDGAGKQTTDSALEVSGVTVAGLPAKITEDGLVVGEPNGGQGPLTEQIQKQVDGLLKDFAIRVTLLPAEEGKTDSGAAFASVGGVLVEFSQDVQDLPIAPGPVGDIDANGLYRGTIQLGNTGALGGVPVIPDDEPVDDLPLDATGGGALDTGGGDLGAGATGDSGDGSLGSSSGDGGGSTGDATGAGAGAGEEAAGGSEQAAESTDGRPVGLVDDLFADRLRLLYLAFTLAVLGLCLAPRLTLPARLPANRQ